MERPRLVPVGRIGRTHGTKGAVKIYPYGETLAQQGAGEKLYLKRPVSSNQEPSLTIVSLKPQGKCWVGQFEELAQMEMAQQFVGEEVFLPEDRLPPTLEQEYYHYQLIGLRVETTAGDLLGTLSAILETGSNDVYVVDRQGTEVLIPALEDVVRLVDLERGRMVVDPPAGLIDDL